jgi:hypothetical protein
VAVQTDEDPVVVAQPAAPPAKVDYFGRGLGSGQRLPVSSRW